MDNFEKFKELTQARDWLGICQINGIALETFGINNELGLLADHLEEDEVVFALTYGKVSQSGRSSSLEFSPNTWLVALTSKRFLAIDHATLTTLVRTQSVEHDRVQSVSASQGWMLAKVLIDIGDLSIVIRAFQKATVPVFVDLANEWLSEFKAFRPTQESSDLSPIEQLEKLALLKSSGVLSDDEFEATKKKILGLF